MGDATSQEPLPSYSNWDAVADTVDMVGNVAAAIQSLSGVGIVGAIRTQQAKRWLIGNLRAKGTGAVSTARGLATQTTSGVALAARRQVESGATLYRVGTTGKSGAAEAQFWALEHPSTPGFAGRYGIPPDNVLKANFVQTATLRPGAGFVTRVAPRVGGTTLGEASKWWLRKAVSSCEASVCSIER
jgi:hypothetical protein